MRTRLEPQQLKTCRPGLLRVQRGVVAADRASSGQHSAVVVCGYSNRAQ